MFSSVKKYKYIILGAGPSGLSFGRTLLDHGEESLEYFTDIILYVVRAAIGQKPIL